MYVCSSILCETFLRKFILLYVVFLWRKLPLPLLSPYTLCYLKFLESFSQERSRQLLLRDSWFLILLEGVGVAYKFLGRPEKRSFQIRNIVHHLSYTSLTFGTCATFTFYRIDDIFSHPSKESLIFILIGH